MSEINAFISEMDAFTFGITAFISRWMHFRIAIPILELRSQFPKLRSQSQNCGHNSPSRDPNPGIAITIPQVAIPIPELRSQFEIVGQNVTGGVRKSGSQIKRRAGAGARQIASTSSHNPRQLQLALKLAF
jgi:hypothetical protein